MCYSRDYRAFEQGKEKTAEDMRAAQERRAAVVDTMLDDAKRHAETKEPERAPAREAAPAK